MSAPCSEVSVGDRRIQGSVVDLDQDQVRDFFESRGKGIDPASPITSILYQDKHPEVARERDLHESRKVVPLLRLGGAERVLDLGCGIGRWAGHLGSQVEGGLGLDVSESLIEFARTQRFGAPWRFEVLSADELSPERTAAFGFAEPFDLVVVSGVCIYLNDDMLDRMLGGVASVTHAGSTLYIREPVGRGERLTLDGFWSELGDRYSAIYRTIDDYVDRLRTAFGEGAETLEAGPMYEDPRLHNRRETFQYFWLLRRG